MDTFGSRLRKLRKNKGLTQKKLGSLVGVSGPMVTQWEGDIALPKKDNADRLCNVLNTTWEYLKTGQWSVRELSTYESAEPPSPSVQVLSKSSVIPKAHGMSVETSLAAPEIASLVALLKGSGSTFAFIEDSSGMMPRIMPGEMVLIDPDATGPSGEWAFDVAGEVVIGVVNKTPKGLMLSFYNNSPGWEPVPVASENSIGKVVASIPVTEDAT